MKTIGLMLFLSGALFLTGCKGSKTAACDEGTSRLVARAYVLSIPLMGREKELLLLMQKNRSYFTEDGRATQCMEALGTALMQGGLSQSQQFSGYSATERFGNSMPSELADLPGQVDDSLRSYGSDMFAMGQELLWLSKVLPPAAQGNYTPYKTTGTTNRQMMAQVLPMYQMLCQMEPDYCQAMRSMFVEMAPTLEQQIQAFAYQLRN